MSIEFADIDVRLGGRSVLRVDRLTLEAGELTVVVGPNGAGKSTLMRVMSGELVPHRGNVALAGRRLADWTPAELATARAVLPQATTLAFPFTVFEVVGLGLISAGRGLAAPDRRRRVEDALARAGLADYAHRFYQQLSGGEQQRVQFARVLCQLPARGRGRGPTWLMLDEPTASLDLRHQFAILDEARNHAHRDGGAVAILHDLNLASLYADRLLVLGEGGLKADGRPGEVLSQRLVEDVFGVRLAFAHGANGRPFVLPERAATP
ncbi:heme ABC transporter ATP-binding protein [Lutibaculum baratangense]|uniref:ABC-type hemin transport system, ATPase component n=1 Tax=Lutibaculum baratangense AMV1 TaxID=631454 RepID=V4TC40_9HYPH|nr:heme ABC transporter ATP-binding protein [Lutibaculum baratangense]ESR23893.1 ABC-type hemin transport system, ATPase component [Lutibaculum baratangense AMV1]